MGASKEEEKEDIVKGDGASWGRTGSRRGGGEYEKEVVVGGEVSCFVYILAAMRQVRGVTAFNGRNGFQWHAGRHLRFERRAPAARAVPVRIVIWQAAWRKTAFTELEEEEESQLSFQRDNFISLARGAGAGARVVFSIQV